MRFSFKPLAIAIAFSLAHVPLQAQDAPDTEDAAKLDAVTVTGSNLKGINLEDAQPVVVVTAEDIRSLGALSLTDLVAQISQTVGGTGNFSTSNSGAKQADSPAGAAGISLRGLGTASTLTLVNGRRIAASSFANGSENFVDINAIPMAAVDRVEVLTTGASAIYGADAVAGVVNVILRRDFEGLRLASNYGNSFAGTDEAKMGVNLIAGFVGDRSRGMLVLDAYQRNALYDRDRSITAREPRPSQQGIYPSFNDLFDMEFDLVEQACPDDQRFDGRPGFPISRFGAYCELNRNAFTATDPETRRLGAYGTFGYTLANNVEYFAELALQRNTSQANSEPAPWSQEEIDFNHPNMPAELRARLIDAGADPRFTIFGWGRFQDQRTIEVKTENWRLLQGLRGYLGTWDWESSFTASRSDSRQNAVGGIYNVERIRAGLLGELCASGATNCSPGNGGLYYNPFGGQDNSAQILDLVRERVPRDGSSELYAGDLKFSGSYGSLGGGEIAWAFGLEARSEDIRDRPSALATVDPDTGEVPVYGFGSTAVSADRTQSALYVESFLPFTERFDARLAVRYDHYSDFGGDLNPALGLRWRASESVLLRGGWNSSFRAPSLAQVGAGTTLSSGALPCAQGSEFFNSFCGGFAGDDFYLSEIYGNPDLEAENSTAWYLGTVFGLGDRTTLSLDYWSFDQRNLVDIDPLELFRQALVNPDLLFARGELPGNTLGIETRNGTIGSPIEQVNLQLINVGRQRTDGVDLSLEHLFANEDYGRFRYYFDATWVNSFERSESCSPGDANPRRGAGPCANGLRLVERSGEFRYPEWLVATGVNWRRNDWSARLWANWVDSYFDDDQRDGVEAGRRVASWTTLNLTLGYDFGDHASLDLNIRNLADRDPPLAFGSAANVDLYNHNTLGRFYSLSYVHRF